MGGPSRRRMRGHHIILVNGDAMKKPLLPLKYDEVPWPHVAFFALVAGAIVLHTYSIGHLVISEWDESIHAVVAEHLAVHPWMPTLYETAALTPPAPSNWGDTHIWLHKPPLGLWAAALSMRLLGYTTFALRLPGVIFISLGMLTTYLLGRRLYGSLAGLVGATFIGYAPLPLLLSQGYSFGDITDTPLLLFAPLAVLALVTGYRSGRVRWFALAGVCMGLCYLSAAALGWAPIAVALALYASERFLSAEPGWQRIGVKAPLISLGAAVAVAAPYNVYAALAYTKTSAQERDNWLAAFLTNYENWERPLDTHFTAYEGIA
jgi:Dolichyl-phosphate-mannose-protein mannosyltransferase